MASLRRRRGGHEEAAAEEEHQKMKLMEAEAAAQEKLRLLLKKKKERSSWNAAFLWGSLLFIIVQASWLVYYFQCLKLPRPVPATEAGKRGFSEHRAYDHVRFLTSLGPHPVGSRALDKAVEYVLSNVEEIQAEAPWDVDVEVDFFHSRPGVSSLVGGIFKGKTLVYSNLKHVIVRVKPASVVGAEKNSILVSSHIDTVIFAPGAGDCNSNIGAMLELVRVISHWAHGFKHAVIFLFNTGEEEGLIGAHGFITQHPWSSSIRTFIDLEATGVGGKSTLFQGGPDKGIVELYAKAAKHPSAQIAAQDLFRSGLVKSATDFQVYEEVANLSGLDVAFMQNVAVYHTKNDKLELLTPGSLQHVGDNVLAFLLEAAVSNDILHLSSRNDGLTSKVEIVYFDILGKYFITYTQSFAKQLYISIIAQTLLLLLASLCQGGFTSVMALFLSVRCLIFSWVCAITLSFLAGVGLSSLTTATVPYIAHPWLVIGLFGSPALLGSLLGQYLGYRSLKGYLFRVQQQKRSAQKASKESRADVQQTANETDLMLAVWDAERWLFKAGIVQWLGILIVGVWLEVGASYIAFLWIVSPALAYGLIDATFSPQRSPGELKTITLFAALSVPLIITAGSVIQLVEFMIGNLVHFDWNPGMTPFWLGNSVVAVLVAIVVCLFFVYLLPFAYRSGGFKWILSGLSLVYIVTLLIVAFEILPPFTEHCSRALNVLQIVEVGSKDNVQSPRVSYVSLSSLTPGTLNRELSFIEDEGFHCGKGDDIDMVTHTIKYGCTGFMNHGGHEAYWNEFPTLKVSEREASNRDSTISILIETKMARRWMLAMNTTDLKSFELEAINRTTGGKEMLAPMRNVTSVNGWHKIQFVTDQDGPSSFKLSLIFTKSVNSMVSSMKGSVMEEGILLKLRTDVNQVTPTLEKTLQKLPNWVALFGKSTLQFPLAYLVNLTRTVDMTQ